MGLVWLALAVVLVIYPRQCQSMSKRFEEGKTMIPFPPILGVPLWAVRLCGTVAAAGAALFFIFFSNSRYKIKTSHYLTTHSVCQSLRRYAIITTCRQVSGISGSFNP